MEEKKLVSIIMPTYNCADFILESVQSVISQTYKRWELIIVDDCSTDNTQSLIQNISLKEPRIKFLLLTENKGAAMARNFGMEKAEGSYIAFLDSDDLWHSEKLNRQINFMESNNYNFSFTSYQQIDEKGNPLKKVIKAVKKVNYNGVLLSCPIGNSSVIFNRDKLGNFTVPDIRKRNDDALWLKMLKKEKYAYGLPEVLMYYRIRSQSLSRKKLELVKYHWYLYREIEKLSFLRSAWHILCWGFIKIFRIK